MNGIVWTYECDVLNAELSKISLNGGTLQMNDFLQYVNNSILTTVNSTCIRNNLGISEEEANKINILAQRYQVNLLMKEDCIRLPSYETMFKMTPEDEAKSNIWLTQTKYLFLLIFN